MVNLLRQKHQATDFNWKHTVLIKFSMWYTRLGFLHMFRDTQVSYLSYSPVNSQNKSDPSYTSFIPDFAQLVEF